MEDRIISTRPDYPGYKVVKDLGIITGFDHDFRMLRNLWQMDEPLAKAFDDLWKKAEKKGANAVLGVSFALYKLNLSENAMMVVWFAIPVGLIIYTSKPVQKFISDRKKDRED